MSEAHQSLGILLVDDEQVIHDTLGAYLSDSGHHVDSFFDGEQGVAAAKEQDYQLALVDVRMPRMDGLAALAALRESQPELAVVLITGHGDMEMAVKALRLGAADFLPKPVKLLDLDAVIARVIHLNEINRDRSHLRDVVRGLQRTDARGRLLIGDSAAIADHRQLIQQAVEGGAESILITGETGTGKEVVAREIHQAAGGDDYPFIAVSCPSLPDSLVESELFGHTKGAFTGATSERAGAFELANGGTLFLDEVGDLAPAAQASLLRVLETRRLRRVGGTREIEVDVRVVAATNSSLGKGSDFRQDLLYRLNLFPIHLPPLRERREDILPIAQHFLDEYTMRRRVAGVGFTDDARTSLESYDFPGNARELRNIVERAAIIAAGGQIDGSHLNLPTGSSQDKPPATGDRSASGDERDRIIAALERAHWNRREAARSLAMPYSTLRYKIQRLNIT